MAQPKKAWPVQLKGAEKVVYKTVGETRLNLHIFRPLKQKTKAPAIVFFFGGGWESGFAIMDDVLADLQEQEK